MKFDNMTLQEKIDTREHTIKALRELNEGCKNENGEIRSMTAEENSKFDAMKADVENLTAMIDAEKRSNVLGGFATSVPVEGKVQNPVDPMADFRSFLSLEKRDLYVDGVGATASSLAPEQFIKEIIHNLEEASPIIKRVNTVHLSKVASIGVPYESAAASDAAWTDEIPASITADSSLAYGKKTIGANQLVKLIKVSKKLLKTSAFNIDQLVSSKLQYLMGQAIEKGILSGTGDAGATAQPQGIFDTTGSGKIDANVSDVQTATNAVLSGDDIIKAKRHLKQGYRSNAVWIFNPEIVTGLLTLKDSNGQYIWRSGLTAGDPDTLDGSPIIESIYAPDGKTSGTATTGNYVGAYCDLSKYWLTIVDQLEIEILKELYSGTSEVGYKSTLFSDGLPVLSEAFARIKW